VSRKTLRSEDGLLEIAMPRDREGGFEPRLIAKGQTRLDGLDDKSEPASRHRFETAGERALRAA
jgi:transposase-like protein